MHPSLPSAFVLQSLPKEMAFLSQLRTLYISCESLRRLPATVDMHIMHALEHLFVCDTVSRA